MAVASFNIVSPKTWERKHWAMICGGIFFVVALAVVVGVALGHPSKPEPPTPGPSPGPINWHGEDLAATHYWDCNGQGCDFSTCPDCEDQGLYVSPAGYGPQDPMDFGGPKYGETLWLLGAASDLLANLLGLDDGCCGTDTDSGGCGKCLLIENPNAVESGWRAVVMKKNRCPPNSHGCKNAAHFDIAVPGFDNLKFSKSNICGDKHTGFDTPEQSATLGSWYNTYNSTADAIKLCDKLPKSFQKGCKLFAAWGWYSGDPSNVKYKAVDCPTKFVEHVSSCFDKKGPVDWELSAHSIGV